MQVELHPLLHFVQRPGLAPQAMDLGPTGDPWLDPMPPEIAVDDPAIIIVVGNRMRPRADQLHCALQDIDQLRQLIKAGASQKPTDGGNSRIVLGRLTKEIFAFFVGSHGAELKDLE